MVNTLEAIRENIKSFEELSPYPLTPFWAMPDFTDEPYWGRPVLEPSSSTQALFISGPSRNGNHLVHSMLDSHPQLPRLPGEDSFLAVLFEDLLKSPQETVRRLKSKENVDYILNPSGDGPNKWKLLSDMAKGESGQQKAIWSGIQPGKSKAVTDYQDTVIAADFAAFETRLKELAEAIRKAPTLMDVLWMYLDALNRLDPMRGKKKFDYLLLGSGMRIQLKFIFSRSDRIKCITPIRPFESYYFSFAKGRLHSSEISADYIQEAWEHWWHKVVDYLLLKKDYPHLICLVNFAHILQEPELVAREICRFLGIEYDTSCLTPTTMGVPVKGNSSFPKDEQARGTFYKMSLQRQLPEEHWPELYPKLWQMVCKLAV